MSNVAIAKTTVKLSLTDNVLRMNLVNRYIFRGKDTKKNVSPQKTTKKNTQNAHINKKIRRNIKKWSKNEFFR